MNAEPTKRGQLFSVLIKVYKRIMSFSLFARRPMVVCWCLLAASSMAVFAQDGFPRQGGEYALAGVLPGDQVHPQVSLTSSGGYVVWQDNAIDNNGLGIGAMQLDGSFTGSGVPFR